MLLPTNEQRHVGLVFPEFNTELLGPAHSDVLALTVIMSVLDIIMCLLQT
jgi:hypothetical protein